MTTTPRHRTIDRILDAAEALFAQKGYEGAAFRDITKKAGVNLAAAHYHIGSKEALFALVLARRLRPLNEVRLARLEEAERQAGGHPVPLAVIFEIMVRPVFELPAGSTGEGAFFLPNIGRSLTDPLPFMHALLAKEFHPVMARFGQAVRRHVPAQTPEDFLWRLNFVVGALHHTFATQHRMQELTRGICRNHDSSGAMRRFISFAVAAFSVPAEIIPESVNS